MWMFVGRQFHDPRRNLHAKPRYLRNSENVSMADIVVKSVLRTKAEDWAISGQVLQSIGTTLPSRVGDMESQGSAKV